MKKSRTIAIILTAILAAGTVSCGGAPAETKTTTAAPGNETTSEVTTVDNSSDNLPAKDFAGRDFNVLAANSTAYKGYIDVEEATGDVLNDAIYASNRAVEERFNFVIKQEILGAVEANSAGEKTILAGDSTYDAISLTDRLALSYAVQGMLVAYDDMPNIDLTKSYWCGSINDSMTIGGKHWLAYSDFNLSVYDYTFVLAFNKQMLDDLNLDNPYDLVDSGKWTYDAFNKMCLAAVKDLNGDSKMDKDDQYGWSGDGRQILPCMWVAADVTPVSKDKDDMPYFSLSGDEKFAEVYQRIYDLAWKNDTWFPVTGNININKDTMFSDGNALFQTTSFGLLDSDYYRSMTTDFGILPHPKYTEAQGGYYSRVEGGRIFAIPVTISDEDFTGTVLEALSCQAGKDVIPAYFEIALKTKYTRDDESARMFDLIMETRIYDLADTFWCSQIRDGFLGTLFKAGKEDLASAVAANKDSVEETIKKTVDALAK